MAGLTLWEILAGFSVVSVVWALVGVYYNFGMVIYGLGICREVGGMAISEIHVVEGNYTEPNSHVVLTETP